ncbi:MAG: hypothetical protein IJR15_02695 [Clostridiales bacterium]|nr:hypothetical protein [Clostridiales bacterium]
MAHVIHDFTYDGTIEGLLSVYLKCIAMKVRPLDIKPEFMVRGKPFEERYLFVRTNAAQADRLYRYMGQCASAELQQMITDCFLTSLPRMELDLYELISRGIRFGACITEDYEDETMNRIQMAIRDLYRESQTIIQALDVRREGGVSVMSLNPRNCVLPLIRNRILNDPGYDDLLAYDRRHCLLLMRNGCEDDLLDIRRLPIPDVRNTHEVFETFWPYVTGGMEVQCRRIGGRGADSLSPLWRIA